MRLIIQPDYSGISNWVADYIAGKINQFSPTDKRPFVLGLASYEAIEAFVEY
jgi:glucosamine-6-phosphate deaminase